MNLIEHYASCPGWDTGELKDCTCYQTAAFRIRKDNDERYPWRIWRCTSDLTYEPVMRCTTWEGALALVFQFIWLRHNALNKDLNV